MSETPTRLETLAVELETLRSEIDELDKLEAPAQDAPEADRTAYDEKVTRYDAALDEWDTKKAEHDKLHARSERADAVRTASFASPANREKSTPDIVTRNERDPFENMDQIRAGLVPASEIRSRAMDVVEGAERLDDSAKEHVTRLLEGKPERGGRHSVSRSTAMGVARHILETGTEEYLEAFERYVEDPEGNAGRAALSLTGANGGFLVPFTLDPTIILTNVGSANPFRQISNVKTTATNNWNGVTSAGVNAGWLAEGTEDTDHSPTVGQLTITPQKAAAWVFGSYEVLEDSDFASQFPTLLADAKDRLEEAAFATGTGGTQPKGVVPGATTVTSAGVGTFTSPDVYSVQAALPARFRGPQSHVAWVANLSIMNRIRQFDTAGGSAFWANLGMDQPEQLLGKSIYESTTMSSAITTGTKNLLLGDFSQFIIVDRIGMSVLYEPMVKGVTNARPTGQAGWFAFWRVGSDVSTTAAFRVLVEQ